MEPIQIAKPKLLGNELAYVTDCIESGWISSAGEYVNRFERAFAERLQVHHAATCSNGTVALHLALLALNIGPGDEVIVPTLTYIASANAVVYCGATPIFVDVEPDTMNLSPAEVERAITSKTKAVIAVHLYGHPADMDALRTICDPRGIRIVEDAAEAHGAMIDDRVVGSFGDLATFSFFGNKIMTTGEGGMVTTNSPELDGYVRLFKGQGQDPERRYWFPVVGYNYRMTNVAAAIGLAQLESLEFHLADRRRVGDAYDSLLGGCESLQLPAARPGYTNVRWLYTVVLPDDCKRSRDEIMAELAAEGIETRPVFYPMHHLPPYLDSSTPRPVAERLAAQGLSLPTHGYLTEADTQRVAERLLGLLA
ncbi:MAG: DegT/DnrJ/EryC1/StrS family aminotransferase [Ilumatobacteraceae bacterium]|nr:DegT/DnrJ/EryC1/StrS family aminotransferase [Ilumatobacteraceae bacterium]